MLGVGWGGDVHMLEEERKLFLGGRVGEQRFRAQGSDGSGRAVYIYLLPAAPSVPSSGPGAQKALAE